ncbi:hypothetical protein [Nakamurella deserti]|uniref:hypothetical protein n=1 Tax=Nakamurella deserti TaxID=2164074 RepID=UPI000DBE24A0|nr:hypothetical protein [Nakamurella deserti]
MSETPTTPPGAGATGRAPLWTAAPGWGIAADLTPPEILKSRQISVLRRVMAAGLVGLVLACGGGWYLAARDNDDAVADLAFASDQTVRLQAAARDYADVVSIQNRVLQIDEQIADVMAGDVDLVELMDLLQTNLPPTMTITQQSITVSTSGVAGASAGGVDPAGGARIGTITMSGTGTTLDDLSDYVDRLQTVPGIVDVVPLANSVTADGGAGTQFSLTVGLTDALLSNRFAVGG